MDINNLPTDIVNSIKKYLFFCPCCNLQKDPTEVFIKRLSDDVVVNKTWLCKDCLHENTSHCRCGIEFFTPGCSEKDFCKYCKYYVCPKCICKNKTTYCNGVIFCSSHCLSKENKNKKIKNRKKKHSRKIKRKFKMEI